MRKMLKEAGILFAVTLILGILLGFFHEMTKEPIRLQQQKAVQDACMAVFEGTGKENLTFETKDYEPNDELREIFGHAGVEIGACFAANDPDGETVGYVIESKSSRGYGGDIVLYVGILSDGTIGGVSVLDISETAGLGMEAPNVLTPQFAGRKAPSFYYTQNGSGSEEEVDAISGATITTKAVVNAVNCAIAAWDDMRQGGGANE